MRTVSTAIPIFKSLILNDLKIEIAVDVGASLPRISE
jgi:hypothetical protein